MINQHSLFPEATNRIESSKQNELVSKVEPLPQKSIRQIEQFALKQSDTNLPLAKPLELNRSTRATEEIKESIKPKETLLQAPKLNKLIEKNEQLIKQKAELKKQEKQLAIKQKAAEIKEIKLAKERQKKAEALAKELESEVIASSKKNEDATESDSPKKSDDAAEVTANAEKGEIDKYKQLIVTAIGRRWLMPEVGEAALACQVLVNVGPGGIVLSVDIIKGSGNSQLDHSATSAIMKSSPLPVPDDRNLFDNFRALRLTFRPKGIVTN